jgi:hypothetical protein
MASAASSTTLQSPPIICQDENCSHHLLDIFKRFCAINGERPFEETLIADISLPLGEYEKMVISGSKRPSEDMNMGKAKTEAVQKLMEEFKSFFPHFCPGHQFWFRRALEALTPHDFFNEIAFMFILKKKTVEEDQSTVDLSPEQKLKTVIQQIRKRLEDPGVSALFQTRYPIIQDLDLAQSILFEMMRQEILAKCEDESLLPLFERAILESLRGI